MTAVTEQLLTHTLMQLQATLAQIELLLAVQPMVATSGDSQVEDDSAELPPPNLPQSEIQEAHSSEDDDGELSAEYWAYHARRAVSAFEFDHCFFNANPHWRDLAFVGRVRKQLGTIDALTAPKLYDGLVQYQELFCLLCRWTDRPIADAQAIEEVRIGLAA